MTATLYYNPADTAATLRAAVAAFDHEVRAMNTQARANERVPLGRLFVVLAG